MTSKDGRPDGHVETEAMAVNLPSVRRLEAVGFRAWPASSVYYDGSWLVRLTAGHASKRLNSVNPLDPSDYRDIAIRLDKAARRFTEHGCVLTVRQTPLTPPQMIAHMDKSGWPAFGRSLVLALDLAERDFGDGMDHLPVKDVARFADARLLIGKEDPESKAALIGIINAIKPETGLFLFEDRDIGPTAVSLVVHDNDLAGIMQFAVAESVRRQGVGDALLDASLRWARLRGAKKAWLQVEADNEAAIALYRKAGFTEVYRYVYRAPKV
ncbi:GNAT family N-acetyltransferase [Sinorhizobium alkalisoli]|uniref:GCN5 family acetyltransferase n=1 Tax=Sinorhizobium alkalisoli TaxID=1752398 RepID=A0A1E3VAS6_9HYPH|nr:GNAT family N-acetyltransferase [Sinorhizobium alkalisoli]MCA1492561.1 GNAT family N-acetyltransferase [Ensifer sp. NBAIM29]ODR90702.1 GCN5 family acetyltransferase [Sinorhizobium alkalisoli]QFI67458.1 Histone acetyltransferase HPA2 and related acetyltransferase [Sinorhizobium alkalisoli]